MPDIHGICTRTYATNILYGKSAKNLKLKLVYVGKWKMKSKVFPKCLKNPPIQYWLLTMISGIISIIKRELYDV